MDNDKVIQDLNRRFAALLPVSVSYHPLVR